MPAQDQQSMDAVDEQPEEESAGSSSDAPEEATQSAPSLDLVFGILKNGRRRRVLKYLRDTDGEVTLSDLAEHIAAIENDTTPKRLTSSQRKRVYVGLYQCHLPKMDDAGVIDYNQARGLISRTDQATHFETYLDRSAADSDRPWYRYYGALGVLGIVPLALTAATAVSGAVVSGLWLGVLLAIAGLSVYHWSESTDDDQSDSP